MNITIRSVGLASSLAFVLRAPSFATLINVGNGRGVTQETVSFSNFFSANETGGIALASDSGRGLGFGVEDALPDSSLAVPAR